MKTDTAQTLWGRRDRLRIMAEIMKIAKESQLKTRIMYGVNLSFNQINEYLSFLIEMRFLSIKIENKKKTYKTTVKGYSYIDNYMEMVNLLRPQKLEGSIII